MQQQGSVIRPKEEQDQEREFLVSETAKLLEFEKSTSALMGRADVDEQQLAKMLAERKARRIARIIRAVEKAERIAASKENLKQLDELFPGMALNNETGQQSPKGGSRISPPSSPHQKKSAGSAIAGFTRKVASSSREKKIPSSPRNNKKLQSSSKIRVPSPPPREGSELLAHDGADKDRTDYTLKEGESVWTTDINLTGGSETEEEDESTSVGILRGDKRRSATSPRLPLKDYTKSPTASPLLNRSTELKKSQGGYEPFEDEKSFVDTEASTFAGTLSATESLSGFSNLPPSWIKECTRNNYYLFL